MGTPTMAIISSSLISAALLALVSAQVAASAGEISCPHMHQGTQLTTVMLFDGPPGERADLEPDSVHESRGETRSEWDVAYIFKAGRRLFVECEYGQEANTVVLEPAPSTYICEYLARGEKEVSLVCKSR